MNRWCLWLWGHRLADKVVNDAVKGNAVVEVLVGQLNHAARRSWGFVFKQLEHHVVVAFHVDTDAAVARQDGGFEQCRVGDSDGDRDRSAGRVVGIDRQMHRRTDGHSLVRDGCKRWSVAVGDGDT